MLVHHRAVGAISCALILGTSIGVPEEAQGAESAQGVYVLGNRGPLAGVTPPPGFYIRTPTVSGQPFGVAVEDHPRLLQVMPRIGHLDVGRWPSVARGSRGSHP